MSNDRPYRTPEYPPALPKKPFDWDRIKAATSLTGIVCLALSPFFVLVCAGASTESARACIDAELRNPEATSGDMIARGCFTNLERVQARLRRRLADPLSFEDANRLLTMQVNLHGRGL